MTSEHSTGMPPLADDFYRRLLGGASVAMIATDVEYRIVCWNSAAGRLLRMGLEEMLGKSIYELIPVGRHKLLSKLLKRTTERREPTHIEIHLPAGAGDAENLVFLLSPIADERDAVQGVAAWILDETHRTRLSERLARAEKLAAVGTLARGVAHHFNNILGGVATFVDFALSSGKPHDMKRALQMTTEAASRATKITQSLLSFAKADPHRTDLADLTEVVLTFAHLVEHPLAERNYDFQLNLYPVPIIAVEAVRMHQVLGNLLTNAEEAMPDGGKISISIDRDGDEVALSFADTGCGVEADKLQLIFEPFYTTKGLLAGGDQANPGLGLSVVHGIVMEMGGRIDVESEVGKGSRVLIRFPIPPESADKQ